VRPGARAFLLFLAAAACRAASPPAAAPDYAQFGTPDQAAGREAIERARRAVPDQCYLEFNLRILPRRGEARVVPGRLWGSRGEKGPLVRIVLDPGAPDERRWLVRGGIEPAVWRSSGRGPVLPADSFEPLWGGVELTPFDLQLTFLYWPDEQLIGVNRVIGRPANAFVFRPPPAFAARHPEVAGVRAHLDSQYDVPLQTEILGADRVLKTLSLVDVKLIGGQAIAREVDARDEATRDKTRFEVSAAALGLDLSPMLFDPARLGDDVSPPAGKRLVRFGP